MKPLVKTVATTAVVLTALAGCASRSSGGSSTSAAGAGSGTPSASSSSSSAGQTPSTSPSNAGPSSGGQTGASNPSNPGTVKYVPLQGLALEKDGSTLATEVNWGGCNDQPQIVVKSQDATKVVVELKTVSHYRVGIMCPDIARTGQATVKLDAPLGGRQVIDGVTNAAISVS